MNVLVLTNPEHIDFVVGVIRENPTDDKYVVQYLGKATFPFLDYDIGVSFMYQYKVPAKELNHTWFNFHPAPLPEYKGRNLCYHAIMNGEKSFGATVHYMDEDFDTGDIIKVVKFPVYPFHVADDVSFLAMRLSKSLFTAYFPRIIAGEEFPRLPNKGGTYYKKQEIEDAIPLNDVPLERWIRAVTYRDFYPKIDIGGVVYKIVRDE